MSYIRRQSVTRYTAAGGIQTDDSVAELAGAGVIAMTLPNPETGADGAILHIVATTAQAHTVTNTTGFNAGSTASDVATFGGARGDSMTLVALGGVWYVLTLRNVMLD